MTCPTNEACKMELIRIKLVKDVPKGARDTLGRFIKTGPRFTIVRKGELGYDKAGWSMAHICMGPRFKLKAPPRSAPARAAAVSVSLRRVASRD